MFGRNILILAPHPDDEIVGCGYAIERARTAGSAVHVLFLTTGLPAADAMWPWMRHRHPDRVGRRRREAGRVAELAGIHVAGFGEAASRALRQHFTETRATVLATVEELAADMLWVPAFEGGHQDHDVANAIAATLGGSVEIWEYAAYNLAGGRVRSNRFPEPSGEETMLVPTEAERTAKRDLLLAYASEAANLRHIRLERECFRPLASYDYGHPPHAGTLFFARFRWVPFRHPRVDFTDPDAVYADIARSVAECRHPAETAPTAVSPAPS